MIFESHAHYNDRKFDEDRDEIIDSLKGYGVGTVINVGDTLKSSEDSINLAEKYEYFYAAVGVHPENASEIVENPGYIEILRQQATEHKKVVAIGEIGLDYYWEKTDEGKALQRKVFAEQLELAAELKLPVIIHSRDACKDTLDILVESEFAGTQERISGVMHCYSYSPDVAAELVGKYDMYIGVGGVVTFKNAAKLVQTVENIPIERILVETDCPYMAPEPNRGKRNFSGYLPFVIQKIAEIKGISPDETERITEENGRRLFGI